MGAVVGQKGALGREFSGQGTARDMKPAWGEGSGGEDLYLRDDAGESGVGREGREAPGRLSFFLG